MATSSFTRNFTVKPEKVTEFVDEMSKEIPSTLNKDFQSGLVSLSQEKDLKEKLSEALSKNR